MSARLPTVVLEEIEHHFDEIMCLNSFIYLYFSTFETAELAFAKFSTMEEFFVITSHQGCNNDGEREAYR